MTSWSSGWVEIPIVGFPQVRNLNFTHNLGTSDLVFSVYWYDTAAANTDPISAEGTYAINNGYSYGSRIKILNDNDVTLSLMKDGFSGGDWRPTLAPAYIKLVAISAVADPEPEPTAAGASWSSGWVDTDGTTAVANGATLSFNHSLGIEDLVFEIFARDANGGTNSVRIDTQDGDAGSNYGAQIQNIETNTFTIQLAQNGIIRSSNNGGTSAIDWDGQQIKILAAAITANEPEAAGTEVIFIEPYDITPVDGAWTKIDAQPAWANSNARTLVVKAETVDADTGGNTNQSLKARTSAASTIEVDIITHGGTSGQRSVASEQALIPCSEDGSFEYHWYRSSSNGGLRSFRVVGYIYKSPFLTGAGDLCKLFPDDSGYQMFRNGLTMQWMSSPAFTTETSQVVNFPVPFASKPFKVVASTRFPSGVVNTHETMQVVSWDASSVTILAQSITGSFNPVYADIIAIGIAEVTGCSTGGGGGGGGGDVDGIKVSQLTNAAELKDDDLFLLSRDNEPDGSYDISKNVKLSDIAKYIAGAEPPAPTPPAEGIVHFSSKIISNAASSTESKAFEDDDSSDITAAGVYEIQSTYAFESFNYAGVGFYTRLDPNRSGDGWSSSTGLGKAVPTVAKQDMKSMAIPAGTTVKFSLDWTHLGATYVHHQYTREDLVFFEITGPALIVDLSPGESLPDASSGTHLASMGITQAKVYNWYNILPYPENDFFNYADRYRTIFDQGQERMAYEDITLACRAPKINSLYHNLTGELQWAQYLNAELFFHGDAPSTFNSLFKVPASNIGTAIDQRTLRNMPYTSTLIIE